MSEAKTAKNSNFWMFWSITLLICHLFKSPECPQVADFAVFLFFFVVFFLPHAQHVSLNHISKFDDSIFVQSMLCCSLLLRINKFCTVHAYPLKRRGVANIDLVHYPITNIPKFHHFKQCLSLCHFEGKKIQDSRPYFLVKFNIMIS